MRPGPGEALVVACGLLIASTILAMLADAVRMACGYHAH